MKREQTQVLNLFKGISAIIIACFYHYKINFCNMQNMAFPFDSLGNEFLSALLACMSDYGFLLVELFFEISGFLFVLAYEKRIRSEEIGFDKFIKKRIIRIYPMMILTTLTMAFLELFYYSRHDEWWRTKVDLWHILINMFGVQVGWFEMTPSLNHPTWYLSVLMQCYIFAFIFEKIVARAKNAQCILVIPLLMALAIENSALIETEFFICNRLSVRGIEAFFVGVILAKLIQKHQLTIEQNIKKLVGCCYMIIGLIILLVKHLGIGFWGDVAKVLVFCIYPVIIILVCYSPVWGKVGNSRGGTFLGNISYEIYLWNLPIQLLTVILYDEIIKKSIPADKISFFVWHMFISIIMATIMYLLVEKPINNKLKWR